MSTDSQPPGRLRATWTRYRQQSNRIQFVIAVVVLGAMLWLCNAVTPSGAPPTPTPTVAPATETPEPTETPAPTTAPTDTPEPTDTPTEVPTQLPPTEPPAPTVAEPTQPPPPSGNIGGLDDIPPADQPWLPCAQGQVKANLNSGVYHRPNQQHYRRTYANVQCFNTAEEAQAAGFRPAER